MTDKQLKVLKEALKDMKVRAMNFLSKDYRIGYISAVSTIEGLIEEIRSDNGK